MVYLKGVERQSLPECLQAGSRDGTALSGSSFHMWMVLKKEYRCEFTVDWELKNLMLCPAWLRGYKTFFMLNSTEHKISTATDK